MCDLIGAFLLSIPMVWDVDLLIGKLDPIHRYMDKISTFLMQIFSWIGVTMGIIAIIFIGMAFYAVPSFEEQEKAVELLVNEGIYTSFSIPDAVIDAAGIAGGILLAGFLCGVVIGLVLLFLQKIQTFFIWVKEEQREKRVGMFGLWLLCIGFCIQAVINFI